MSREHLAVLGGAPEFNEPLHVGRPNIGSRAKFLERVEAMFDRRWLTNGGPLVREFEERIAERLGVEHVIAVCNATLGLEIVLRAVGATGEVIVPSFTFVATAHSVQWQGLTPVFADVDPVRHVLDPGSVRSLITPRTSAVVGVHTWGNPCPLRTLVELAAAEGISLIFDAAHAFGSRYPSRFVGLGGAAEVFSFHATKFLNAFEGGAIATRDDELASRARDMVNFGFRGYDDVRSVGTNAKMTEVSAAMGLTSLEAETSIRQHNVEIWQAYSDALDATEFLRLMRYPSDEENSHQYVVVEVLSGAPLSRDLLVRLLHAEGCLARRYFYPGVHRMQPYSALNPMADRWLPVTLELCRSVLVLPTGTAVTPGDAVRVVTLMLEGFRRADVVRNVLGEAIQGG